MTAVGQAATSTRKACARFGRLGQDRWKSLVKPGFCRGSPTTFPAIWQPEPVDDGLEPGPMRFIHKCNAELQGVGGNR